MVKKYRRKRLSEPVAAADTIYDVLKAMGGVPEKGKLAQLWEKWEEALGERLASLAAPLGSKGSILLIKAEDALQMQELHFMSGELLEKANSFLEGEYFSSIRITLFGNGKICRVDDVKIIDKNEYTINRAILTGEFLATMDSKSPVAACYARFIQNCT